MLKLLRLIISSAGTALFMSGCMSCSQYLQNTRYITPETGEQLFCTHHRIPLLTVTGFTEPRFAHVDGFQRDEMTREAFRQYEGTLFACNPNCVQPHYSLQRHGRLTAPVSITYCFKCEQAVAPYRNASNQAMQRTAGRTAFELSMTSTFQSAGTRALASGR
jgi:hypothetical protein